MYSCLSTPGAHPGCAWHGGRALPRVRFGNSRANRTSWGRGIQWSKSVILSNRARAPRALRARDARHPRPLAQCESRGGASLGLGSCVQREHGAAKPTTKQKWRSRTATLHGSSGHGSARAGVPGGCARCQTCRVKFPLRVHVVEPVELALHTPKHVLVIPQAKTGILDALRAPVLRSVAGGGRCPPIMAAGHPGVAWGGECGQPSRQCGERVGEVWGITNTCSG